MLDFENLKNLPIAELRQLAVAQGLTPHHRAGADTIIKQIVEHVTALAPSMASRDHPAIVGQSEKISVNTRDQIMDAIKDYASVDGFKIDFDEPAGTWRMRYKNSEDSGHMSVPLRIIKMKAESVVRARTPLMIDLGDGPIMAAV